MAFEYAEESLKRLTIISWGWYQLFKMDNSKEKNNLASTFPTNAGKN